MPSLTAAQPLRLASALADAVPAGEGTELFLEVTLNGVPTGTLARFLVRDEVWWVATGTLQALGLGWPDAGGPQEPVALASLPGLKMSYDQRRQRIDLVAPVQMLDRPEQKLAAAERPGSTPDAAQPALLLSYDLYGQRYTGPATSSTLSAWTEARMSGVGPGIWEASALTLAQRLPGATLRETVRLDTRWQLDAPARMLSLTAGDTQTGALSWTRVTRLGGLRLSRNLALQPYLATAPSALVRGEAVLPSTVDLYINGLRQVSRPVQPGVFTVEGAPMLNGAGQARLVVTDVNGQQRVVDIPLYGTPQLLRAGLLDGSVELGAVREDYGLRSASYGRVMASATARYGWTDRLTVEGHAEADSEVAMAGVGGSWLLPAGAGVLSVAAAASSADRAVGRQGSLGYQWSRSNWSLAASTLRRDAAFRDVATGYGAPLPRVTDQVFAGLSSGWGSFGVGFVRQLYAASPASRLGSLSWSGNLWGVASLNLTLMRDLQSGSSSAALNFNMALDDRITVATGVQAARGRTRATAAASRSTPGDLPGWGWRAEAGLGNQRSALGQISRLGQHGRWSAGLVRQEGADQAGASTTLYGAASGGLLWAAGRGFALPRVDEAFALVSTDGIAGVPVQSENRPVGVTDADGLLLVRGLRPYERNRLSIDPLTLAPDMRLDAVQLEVVPPGRAGVAARFAMRTVVTVQFALHDAVGEPVPAGSRAWLEAPGVERRPLVVGYDGLVYVENPPAGARLLVELGAQACAATVPAPANGRGLLDGGMLACLPSVVRPVP